MPAGLGTLFAGLLLIVLAFVEGSSVWKSLHEVLFGLFGCGSFVLGAAVCYLAILYTRGEDLLGQVFKLLLGLYPAESGTVTIGGVPVADITDRERRTCIGCVEQRFSRVPGTVLDQITLSDPTITEEMAQNAAKLAGMDDAIRALPDGYNTICTDGMFSQGEWQLLSIARAAAANPAVLLLDEITANLDAETEARVLEALRRASEGRTVLSISHRIYENLGGRTVEIKPYNAYAADSAADCSVKAL